MQDHLIVNSLMLQFFFLPRKLYAQHNHPFKWQINRTVTQIKPYINTTFIFGSNTIIANWSVLKMFRRSISNYCHCKIWQELEQIVFGPFFFSSFLRLFCSQSWLVQIRQPSPLCHSTPHFLHICLELLMSVCRLNAWWHLAHRERRESLSVNYSSWGEYLWETTMSGMKPSRGCLDRGRRVVAVLGERRGRLSAAGASERTWLFIQISIQSKYPASKSQGATGI